VYVLNKAQVKLLLESILNAFPHALCIHSDSCIIVICSSSELYYQLSMLFLIKKFKATSFPLTRHIDYWGMGNNVLVAIHLNNYMRCHG